MQTESINVYTRKSVHSSPFTKSQHCQPRRQYNKIVSDETRTKYFSIKLNLKSNIMLAKEITLVKDHLANTKDYKDTLAIEVTVLLKGITAFIDFYLPIENLLFYRDSLSLQERVFRHIDNTNNANPFRTLLSKKAKERRISSDKIITYEIGKIFIFKEGSFQLQEMYS